MNSFFFFQQVLSVYNEWDTVLETEDTEISKHICCPQGRVVVTLLPLPNTTEGVHRVCQELQGQCN